MIQLSLHSTKKTLFHTNSSTFYKKHDIVQLKSKLHIK